MALEITVVFRVELAADTDPDEITDEDFKSYLEIVTEDSSGPYAVTQVYVDRIRDVQ